MGWGSLDPTSLDVGLDDSCPTVFFSWVWSKNHVIKINCSLTLLSFKTFSLK